MNFLVLLIDIHVTQRLQLDVLTRNIEFILTEPMWQHLSILAYIIARQVYLIFTFL